MIDTEIDYQKFSYADRETGETLELTINNHGLSGIVSRKIAAAILKRQRGNCDALFKALGNDSEAKSAAAVELVDRMTETGGGSANLYVRLLNWEFLAIALAHCVEEWGDNGEQFELAKYVVDHYPNKYELASMILIASGDHKVKNCLDLIRRISEAIQVQPTAPEPDDSNGQASTTVPTPSATSSEPTPGVPYEPSTG